MICKNCGAQLPDNSVFCGNCGSSVTPSEPQQGFGDNGNMPNPAPPAGGFQQPQNPAFDPNFNPNGGFAPNPSPEGFDPNFNPNPPASSGLTSLLSNKKVMNIAVPVVAVVLVLAIVAGIVGGVSGKPEKTIERFMNGFIDSDGKAMYNEISDGYKTIIVALFETADFVNDGELSKELDKGQSVESFVEEKLIDELEDVSLNTMDSIKNSVGSSPDIEFEVTRKQKATKEELEKFNRIISMIGKGFEVKDLMYADVEITASRGSSKDSEEITFFLCKEGSKWKILTTTEVGSDFDDLYSYFNTDSLKYYFDMY